jgi:hypothetical protein
LSLQLTFTGHTARLQGKAAACGQKASVVVRAEV